MGFDFESFQRFYPFLLAATISGICAIGNRVDAESITFKVLTDADTYSVGDTVNWELRFDITASTTSNYGIATIAADLQSLIPETLVAGSINKGAAPTGFDRYVDPRGGTFNGTDTLVEIGDVLFTQNNTHVVGADSTIVSGTVLTNLLLATGSYTVTTAGAHELTAVAGSANRFFTAEGQSNDENLNGNFSVTPGSKSFNVVPEPSALGLLVIGSGFVLLGRRRKS